MSLQEIYTKARTHLLTQMKRSVIKQANGTTICAYRGPNGLKCAAGAFIPDAKYSSELEGKVVTDPLIAAACGLEFTINQVKDATGRQVELVNRLQIIHDNQDPANWESHLDVVATEYGFIVEP